MRYLVKGDCSIPCADLTQERDEEHRRARRVRIRRLLAIACVLLACAFAIPLFRQASDASMLVSSDQWDRPMSAFSRFRWTLNGLGLQFQHGIQGALPYGNFAVILKMSLCAVAAAVFLRSPRRS